MIIDGNLIIGIIAIILSIAVFILWLPEILRLWLDSDTAFLIWHYFWKRKNR